MTPKKPATTTHYVAVKVSELFSTMEHSNSSSSSSSSNRLNVPSKHCRVRPVRRALPLQDSLYATPTTPTTSRESIFKIESATSRRGAPTDVRSLAEDDAVCADDRRHHRVCEWQISICVLASSQARAHTPNELDRVMELRGSTYELKMAGTPSTPFRAMRHRTIQ